MIFEASRNTCWAIWAPATHPADPIRCSLRWKNVRTVDDASASSATGSEVPIWRFCTLLRRFLDEIRLVQDILSTSQAQGIAGGPFSATDIRKNADMDKRAGGIMASSKQINSTVTTQICAPRRETVQSVQLLRAVAALLVVLFHGHLAMSTRVAGPPVVSESYIFAFGAVGVHIFFVISGFIMVYTTSVGEIYVARDFLRRRFLRIYPIYWVCIAIYIFAHKLIGSPYVLSESQFLGALVLAPESASNIIGPAWTLSFEMFFYICFSFAMKLGATRGLILLGATFTISIVAGFFFAVDGALGRLVTNSLLLEFIAGAAIGWLLVNRRLPKRGGPAVVLLAIILFGAGIAVGYDRFPSVAVWGIPSTLLVAGAVIWENAHGFKKMFRTLSHFGNSSYVLYLIHLIVITLTIALAANVPSIKMVEPAIAAFAIALLSLLVAEGLHIWVERPMTRWLNNLFRERAPEANLNRS